jgi:hypothetical protein
MHRRTRPQGKIPLAVLHQAVLTGRIQYFTQTQARGMLSMIVLKLNGKRTELTGWKAWLVGAFAIVPVLIILALVAFFLIGISVTIGAMLLLVIPAAVVVAIIGSLMQRKG